MYINRSHKYDKVPKATVFETISKSKINRKLKKLQEGESDFVYYLSKKPTSAWSSRRSTRRDNTPEAIQQAKEETKRLMKESLWYGGYSPFKVTCIESGFEFVFKNCLECSNFINIDPEYVRKTLYRSRLTPDKNHFLTKNGSKTFKIKDL